MGCVDIADGIVWIVDGAPSAAHWLSERLDVEPCTVRDWLRVGRTLRDFDASAAAWASGEISYAKARALAPMLTIDNETQLLDIARRVPAGQLGRALARWSAANDDDEVIDRRHRLARSFRSRVEADGTIVTTIRQPPLEGATLGAAVEAEVMRRHPATDADGRAASLGRQRHDAFCRVVNGDANRQKIELLVHCDETGTHLPDGTPLSSHPIVVLLDRTRLRMIVHDAHGRPVNASTARRTPTLRQRRVVQSRHPVCTNCGASELLHVHHTEPFERSPRTHTDDLTQLCAPCHRAEHRRP